MTRAGVDGGLTPTLRLAIGRSEVSSTGAFCLSTPRIQISCLNKPAWLSALAFLSCTSRIHGMSQKCRLLAMHTRLHHQNERAHCPKPARKYLHPCRSIRLLRYLTGSIQSSSNIQRSRHVDITLYENFQRKVQKLNRDQYRQKNLSIRLQLSKTLKNSLKTQIRFH